ncbi:MAG: hypothetical protein JWQ32_784 [Marmoricola sp.]|nr:hypothetical protein [Marmoricola sp.]
MVHDTDAGHGVRGLDRNEVTRPVLVVGLDGSPSSWDAFSWAAGEATRVDGRIVAVYVVPPAAAMVSFGVPYDYAAAEQARHDVAEDLRDEAARRAEELGVDLSFAMGHGDATRALTEVARSVHAHLVVVGRSTKVLHRLAGSLSHRITSRNDAPVVVVVP